METDENVDVIHLELPAEHKYLNVLGACIGAMLDRADNIPDVESLKYNMELAVHETCTNIVEHAYNGKNGRINISLSIYKKPGRFIVELRDTGSPFDLTKIQEPDLEAPQIHGYGLFITRQLLDEVDYQSNVGANQWRLVKNLAS